jgi:hypothetical protein
MQSQIIRISSARKLHSQVASFSSVEISISCIIERKISLIDFMLYCTYLTHIIRKETNKDVALNDIDQLRITEAQKKISLMYLEEADAASD